MAKTEVVHLQRDNQPICSGIVRVTGRTISSIAAIRAPTVQPYIYVSLKASHGQHCRVIDATPTGSVTII
jgi:hypothetical protein